MFYSDVEQSKRFLSSQERGQHLAVSAAHSRLSHHNPVRCIAWHPHSTKIAVAVSDDSVRVYTAMSPGLVPTLRSKGQRSVSCLAWR